jgi:hypothetical protein
VMSADDLNRLQSRLVDARTRFFHASNAATNSARRAADAQREADLAQQNADRSEREVRSLIDAVEHAKEAS